MILIDFFQKNNFKKICDENRPNSTCSQRFRTAALAKINLYRAQHGASALKLANETENKRAEDLASKRVNDRNTVVPVNAAYSYELPVGRDFYKYRNCSSKIVYLTIQKKNSFFL